MDATQQQHIALCTRLSRFVQLETLSEHDATLLCAVCSDLVALYEQQDARPVLTAEPTSLFGSGVALQSATMDDIVLLATQKLLLGIVAQSEPRVKESVLLVLARTLARCERQIRVFTESKLLGFLQSCALYLPVPDAALDRNSDSSSSSGRATRPRTSRSLQAQSEELRLHVLTSLQLLLRHRAPSLHLTVETESPAAMQSERLHFFAYVVASLLHVAQFDRCRPAALLAVETLAGVTAFVHDATLLRQFFPGVSVGMWRTATAPQQASKVAAAALECLAQTIALCLNAESDDKDDPSANATTIDGLRAFAQQQQQQHNRDTAINADTDSDSLDAPSPPTDPWLIETAAHVDTLLSRLFHAQLAPRSWRIRYALTALCGAVVQSSALRDSFFLSLDELLVLRTDSNDAVASAAQQQLDALQPALDARASYLDVAPALAVRFEQHLTTLALAVSTQHERASVRVMRQLVAYARFLGPQRLGAHLDAAIVAIYTALTHVFALDRIDMDLVVVQTLSVVNNDATRSQRTLTTSQFQKRLRYLHDAESVEAATELLRAIGAVTTPAVAVDCAFRLLASDSDISADASSSGRMAEVLLVLNGMLRAHVPSTTANSLIQTGPGRVDVHLVGRILEDLLAHERWHELNDDVHMTTLSPQGYRTDVAQRALMVETIGVCVEVLQRDFAPLLLPSLYPLVEKLGSRDVAVERAALATLSKVAFVTDCATLDALFEANMDYFVDALVARLAHLDAYPATARVVDNVLRHTRLAALPLVDEVAAALLLSVDAHQHSRHLPSLLRALKRLLVSIEAERQTQAPPSTTGILGKPHPVGSERVVVPPGALLDSFIDEIRILTDEAKDERDDDDDEPSSIEEIHDGVDSVDSKDKDMRAKLKGAMPVEYGERSPMDASADADDDDDAVGDASASSSPYTALIVEIVDRSSHFLAETDPIACCLVLSMLSDGVQLLRDARTELLPLIHRLWPVLLHRLAVANKPIVTAAVQLVTTIAAVAGDFVGDRVVESVWPALRSQLLAIEVGETTTSSSSATQLTRSMLLLSTSASADDTTGHDRLLTANSSSRDVDTDADTNSVAAPRVRRTLDSQLLLAALECLATVSSTSSAMTQIVPDVAAVTRRFLSATCPPSVVAATQTLFRALAALNGDEVFCALAPLAMWTPPAPPTARVPAFASEATRVFYRAQLASSGAFAALARANAAQLLDELQRSQ